MWLYLIGIVLVIVGLVGTVAGGGVFGIVLIPVGLIVLASAFFYGMVSRRAERAGGSGADAHPSTGRPLPHSLSGTPGHAPTSPEALTDARRGNQ